MTPTESKKPNPIAGIFLTVFLDLLSFGIFIPDLQLRGEHVIREFLGSKAPESMVAIGIALVLSLYSIASFIASPYLGSLSDRIGRRKILLVTCLMASISYFVYIKADIFAILILTRITLGIAAANVGVAFAYVADVTEPKDRAKSLGALGAAFGLGFIFGPPLGGMLLRLGNDHPIYIGLLGGFLSLINFLYVLFLLPDPPVRESARKGSFVKDLRRALKVPTLGVLLLMFFAVNLGFTNLETTYFRMLEAPNWIHHLPSTQAKTAGSFVLAMVGIVSAFTQAVLVGVFAKYGQMKVLRLSFLVYIPAFLFVPYGHLWVPVLIGVLALAMSGGLINPNMSGIISTSAPDDIQGGVFGVTQGLGALARIIGPFVSQPLFAYSPAAPYWLGGAILAIPAVLIWFVKAPEPREAKSEDPVLAH